MSDQLGENDRRFSMFPTNEKFDSFSMTRLFTLDFYGTQFTVPKSSLFNLFEHQRDLFDATSYEVRTSVPVEIFELLVWALETGKRVPVTHENASAFSLLANEFWLEDLLFECSVLEMVSTAELITALSERISKPQCEGPNEALVARIARVEREIYEALPAITERLLVCETGLEQLNSTMFAQSQSSPPTPAPAPPRILPVGVFPPARVPPIPVQQTPTQVWHVSLDSIPPKPRKRHWSSNFRKEVEFLFMDVKPLDGIISYLTRKHDRNVHDKGIVTITSKSVYPDAEHAPRNVADLNSDSSFCSNAGPGQWICWNFHKIRVSPTHYTIRNSLLKSWVVESSLNGKGWREIDRKTDNDDLKGWPPRVASFAVTNVAECRFIRLTQTGKDHAGKAFLDLSAFEVFGTLIG
jgi:hypothetical protein